MRYVKFKDPTGYERTGIWENNYIKFFENKYSPTEVDILPPAKPTKIICVGINYLEHFKESGHNFPDDLPTRPQLFLKTPNTIAGHKDTIFLPTPGIGKKDLENMGEIETGIGRIDYEAEIGVVIGKQCKNVKKEKAMEVIKGFTCINDISNRDDQSAERNWVRGKSFDNAAPMGPVVATPDLVPKNPTVKLRLNGKLKQNSSGDELIFSVEEVIEEITKFMTLEPDDVIAMGTPSGVGPLKDGDTVEIEIEGVGTLEHYVADSKKTNFKNTK